MRSRVPTTTPKPRRLPGPALSGLTLLLALTLPVPSTASAGPADGAVPPAAGASAPAPSGAAPAETPSSRARLQELIEREGITVEVEMEPVGGSGGDSFQEGDPVHVRFKVRDGSGEPLPGLYPAAWMDRLPVEGDPAARGDGPKGCKEKIEAYVGGSLLAQPELDLNVYYVLALNETATISVVDPLFGFGGSKLLEMIYLKSPGEDWELTEDQRRLFVSMPASDQVAVIDTADWTVQLNVDVGPRPRRLRLQPDGHYLWATFEAEGEEPSGVSVIDTRRLVEVKRITTGRGHHELVFRDDDRYAFVTNSEDDTVSVIDIQTLEKVRDVKVGSGITWAAYSSTGQALYVTHDSGRVTVIDGDRLEVAARIQGEPGMSRIRFSPDGRLGFVVNPPHNFIHIIDVATNRIVQTGEVEKTPFDVSFSDELAYVIHGESEIVLMAPLRQLGREGTPMPVIDFPGGESPPGKLYRSSLADMIVQAPGATAVLVANPDDRAIYFYKEGMAAPMGHFKNYGHRPHGVEVVDRSLQESSPGVYETAVKLRGAGEYDLAFFLDSPRMIHCFDFEVAENPSLAAQRSRRSVEVEVFLEGETAAVGETVPVEVKVTDAVTSQARDDLEDVRVLTFLAPGVWQRRQIARSQGDGRYRIEFTPPQAGVYYVFVDIGSERFRFNESPSVILEVTDPDGAPSRGARLAPDERSAPRPEVSEVPGE